MADNKAADNKAADNKATGKSSQIRQEKTGEVVSTKMAKTIVVQVTRRVTHPLYKRIVTRRTKFYAHDEKREAQIGDTVRIVESRPLSKLKRWTLGEVIRRSAAASVAGLKLAE